MKVRILINFVFVLLLAGHALGQDRFGPGRGGRGASGPPATAAASSASSRPQADPRTLLDRAESSFREFNEEDLKKPPKREYGEVKGPLQKTKLFRADPKLFENKYVVRMVLGHRGDIRFPGPPQPKEIQELITLDSGSSSFESARSFSRGSTQLSNLFKELIERCPADQRPPKSALDYLT